MLLWHPDCYCRYRFLRAMVSNDSWTVSTQAASCSHRTPHCHKIYSFIHWLEPQTCADCSAMPLLSPLHYSSQWTLIQKLMPQLSYTSFRNILLAHCCKKTACQSDIVSSKCHQHYSCQQNNTLTWSCLLQMAYSLGSPPQRPYKTMSSHTSGTIFNWWQDVPGRKPTSS